MCIGWCGRGGCGGSNQVLCNWVDSQIIRTSQDSEYTGVSSTCGGAPNSWFNDFGDFWVSDPSTGIVPGVVPPAADSRSLLPGSDYDAIAIYDMLGRKIYSSVNHAISEGSPGLQGVSLKRGVYIVQRRSGGCVETRKLAR